MTCYIQSYILTSRCETNLKAFIAKKFQTFTFILYSFILYLTAVSRKSRDGTISDCQVYNESIMSSVKQTSGGPEKSLNYGIW